jgi:hypothetical protein
MSPIDPPVVTVSSAASALLNEPGNISAVLAQDVNYALLFVGATITKADKLGAFRLNRPSSGDRS